MGRLHRDASLQLLENKALSCGIIRKSACILAEVTIRKSQTRTVLSSEPEMARCPSGVTATLPTLLVWPSRVARHWPVSMSHARTVLSAEPETARCPSGVIATPTTKALCLLSAVIAGDCCCHSRVGLDLATIGRHAASNLVYSSCIFCRQSM